MKRSILRPIVGFTLLLASLTAAASLQAQQYLTPLKEHAQMAHEVGVWDAEMSMWMSPDSDPTKSKAVETNELVGKMWLMSKFEGEFGGEKFTGRMALGYDPVKKKYIGGWIDSMSPFMMTMAGDYDASAHTLTMLGEGIDVMTGKNSKSKMVTRYEGQDVKVFEMYMPVEGEEGKWWKTLEAKYTRRK